MNAPKTPLDRLFRAAARAARPLPDEVPVGLETRILAHWRSASEEDDSLHLPRLFRWAFVLACLMMAISVAANYGSLWNPAPNEITIADSAIKLSLLP